MTRREFLEHILDAMGDADAIGLESPHGGGWTVRRADVRAALAEEVGP